MNKLGYRHEVYVRCGGMVMMRTHWFAKRLPCFALVLALSLPGCLAHLDASEPEPERDPLTPLAAPVIPVQQAELPPIPGIEERDDADRPGGAGLAAVAVRVDEPVPDGVIDPVTGAFVPAGLVEFLAGEVLAQAEADADSASGAEVEVAP